MSILQGFSARAFLAGYRALHRGRAKSFSLLASKAFASFGPRSVIELPVRLRGEGRISIGADVFVGASSWLQVLETRGEGIALSVGDGTSIAGHCVVSAAESVRIGDRVLIARGVYLADHSHAFERTDRAVLDQGIAQVASVEICDGAWLGENVVIAPGVRVGCGAVVGANSVVLDDVPDYCVAVGAPARVVRHLGHEIHLAG